MLNSAEHEAFNAHKYTKVRKFGFLGSYKPRMLFFLLLSVKMLTIVEKCHAQLRLTWNLFITSEPGVNVIKLFS